MDSSDTYLLALKNAGAIVAGDGDRALRWNIGVNRITSREVSPSWCTTGWNG